MSRHNQQASHSTVELAGLPFDHGFTFTAGLETQELPLPMLRGVQEAIARLSHAALIRCVVLGEPDEWKKELDRLDLTGFWDRSESRHQFLLLARGELRLSGKDSRSIDGLSSRPSASASARLEVVIPFDAALPRTAVLEKLAAAIRLPHEIDGPLPLGQVHRFEADGSLALALSTGERLGVLIRRPGPAQLTIEQAARIRADIRGSAKAATRLLWDVRRGSAPHHLRVEIRHQASAQATAQAVIEASASMGTRGSPDRAEEIIAALLEGVDDEAGETAEQIAEAIPGVIEAIDDVLIRATSIRLRAALEAALTRSVASRSLAEIEVDLDRAGAMTTVRRLALGDLSPLYEPENAIVAAKGLLKEEVARRLTLQFILNAGDAKSRAVRRSDVRASLQRKIRLTSEGAIVLDLVASGRAQRSSEWRGETLTTLFQFALSAPATAAGEAPAQLDPRSLEWRIAFSDSDTSAEELDDYLAYMEGLGFAPVDRSVLEEMPTDAQGRLGEVSFSIEFRFAAADLMAGLSSAASSSSELREAMRRAILIGCLAGRRTHLRDLAWAYWTTGTWRLWVELRRADALRFRTGSPRRIAPIRRSPIPGHPEPPWVELGSSERTLLDHLYQLEENVIRALESIGEHVRGEREPEQVLGAVHRLAATLDAFDAADLAPETLLYVLDAMLPASGSRRSAALVIQSNVAGTKWRKRIPLEHSANPM